MIPKRTKPTGCGRSGSRAQAADGQFPMLQIGPLDVDQRPGTIAADDERIEYDPKPLSVPEVVAFATVVFSVAAFVVLYSLR